MFTPIKRWLPLSCLWIDSLCSDKQYREQTESQMQLKPEREDVTPKLLDTVVKGTNKEKSILSLSPIL